MDRSTQSVTSWLEISIQFFGFTFTFLNDAAKPNTGCLVNIGDGVTIAAIRHQNFFNATNDIPPCNQI